MWFVIIVIFNLTGRTSCSSWLIIIFVIFTLAEWLKATWLFVFFYSITESWCLTSWTIIFVAFFFHFSTGTETVQIPFISFN